MKTGRNNAVIVESDDTVLVDGSRQNPDLGVVCHARQI